MLTNTYQQKPTFFGIPTRGKSKPIINSKKRVVTDWNYFQQFVAARGKTGQEQYDRWIKRRALSGRLLSRYQSFSHEKLYQLRYDDVMRAYHRTTHSLGNLKFTCSKHRYIDDYSPPFAFMFLIHTLLEKLGRVPVWEEVVEHLTINDTELCWDHFCSQYKLNGDGGLEGLRARHKAEADAFQWRIGVIYYSWLREVHFLVSVREKLGYDLRYHFLLDAEWKTDFICEDVLVELYMRNRKYKECTSGAGRKQKCEKVNPGAKIVIIEIKETQQGIRGKPWLTQDAHLLEVSRILKEAGCKKR